MAQENHNKIPQAVFDEYADQWVVLTEEEVVAAGKSFAEVAEKAEQMGLKDYSFFLVPSATSLFAPTGA